MPRQKLVHVHPDSAELGRVYRANLAINTSPAAFCAALAQANGPSQPAWADDTQAMRASYLQWSDPAAIRTPGALQLGEVMAFLEKTLPADAIMANGAGQLRHLAAPFPPLHALRHAIGPDLRLDGLWPARRGGAKRIWPQKTVVCFAGDGCFLMHGQEFATAVQYDLPIVVVLIDNGMYGTIRMHQEKHYPGRISATSLKNPDFAEYARAPSAATANASRPPSKSAPAFERALASSKPAILHCLIDPETITPSTTLEKIRAAALKAQ